MSEHEGALQTRRKFLGLAIGLLTAGCAPATLQNPLTPATSSCTGAGPIKFPEGDVWGWSTAWTGELDKLGRIIMATKNPYCTEPNQASTTCQDTDAKTWPQQLTSADTWRVLTEFDFFPNSWTFLGSPITVQRSMRIPYLIGHVDAKHGHNAKNALALEHLLVGYADDPTVSTGGAQGWGSATACSSGQVDAVGLLAEFITLNMKAKGDTTGFRVPVWDTLLGADNQDGVAWSFRQAKFQVNYPFRLPVAVGQVDAAGNPVPRSGGYIYVGYEGGGAY